jgi:hypothetical protein
MSGINQGWKHSTDQDWNTPSMVWEKIIPHIPPDKQIWCPFYNDGYCKVYLEKQGINVIHNDEDFWNTMYDDVIVVDNPPYKLPHIIKSKREIMLRLIRSDTPFMLLFPTTTIQTAYFKDLKDRYGHFQLCVPSQKYNFEKYEGDKSKCLFYTLWICWKMNLPNDFNVI